MEEIVTSLQLPVHENLQLVKNHIVPPEGQDRGKRLCIVTGTHGDELEGQYVAFMLNRILMEQPENLYGTVDIYPAMNPLGINTIQRSIPSFDIDMNRMFPGSAQGTTMEYYVYEAIEDMKGADIAIDIHASNIFLTELPQVRVSEETADSLVPLAKLLNVDYVWIHSAATVLESTLAHSLNIIGTKCLVVEMGVGMRITKEYGTQLLDGILNLMHEEGMWEGEVKPVRKPIISGNEVAFINANAAGVFIPNVEHNGMVKAGQKLAIIANPLNGQIKEEIIAPADGLLFTLRDYPIVYPGSLLARILTGGERE